MTLKKTNDFYWLTFARVMQLVLSLASLRIMTTLLSVEQFGLFVLLTSIRSFIGLFIVNPVGQYINRHTHEWYLDNSLVNRLKVYNNYICYASISAFIVVLFWFSLKSESSISNTFINALIVGCVVYASTWNSTIVPILNMLGHRSTSATLEVCTLAMTLLLSVIFCNLSATGSNWLLGGGVASGIVAMYAWILTSKLTPESNYKKQNIVLISRRDILSYCLPLAGTTVFLWLFTNGYRLIIDWKLGATALGIFVLSFTIASQLWSIIETLAIQFLFPHFYKGIASTNNHIKNDAYSNLVNSLVPIYIVILAAMIICADAILGLLVDTTYLKAKEFIYFAIIFEWFRATSAVFANGWQIEKNMLKNIYGYAISASAGLIGTFIVVNWNFDFVWIGYTLVLSGLMLLSITYVMTTTSINCKLSPTYILISLLLLLASSLLVRFTDLSYDSYIGNLSLILIIGLITFTILFFMAKNNRAYKNLLSIKL